VRSGTPPVAGPKQSFRRDLGKRIKQPAMLEETANDIEAPRRRDDTSIAPELGPPHREIDRERTLMIHPVGVPGEAHQLLPLDLQGEAELATHRQVLHGQGDHGGAPHDRTRGQGKATAASRGRSTLA